MAPEPRAWKHVLRTSRRQLGLVLVRQAEACGVTRKQLRGLARRGLLERWGRGLYAVAGMPDSWERRALAALLLGGDRSVLCGLAAAYLHGLRGVTRPDVIELLFPRGCDRRVPEVTVRTTRILPPQDIAEVGPHRLTSVARTIRDLGHRLDPDRCEEMFHEAWRLDRTDPDDLRACHERFPARARPRAITTVLERADPRFAGLRSPVEGEALRRVRASDLPMPEVDHEIVVGDGTVRFFADLAYPDVMVAVEVDPPTYHTIGPDRERDAVRQRALEEAGWLVIRVTSAELRWRPELFLSRLRAALIERGHPAVA